MKIAIMISNMGGPDSLDAVEPYLQNIFNDPDIIDIPLPDFLRRGFVKWLAKRRGPESREIYQKLGGRTPLTAITEKQAAKLEDILKTKVGIKCKVFSAMRYWHPFIEDVWQKIVEQGFDKLIILTLYPYYSTTTTGSLEKLIARLNSKGDFKQEDLLIIDRFGSHPAFIKAMVEKILSEVEKEKKTDFRDILFSAHSIPMRRIKQGDPYRDEIEQAVKLIAAQLPDDINIHLAYQSKIGPIEWLGPSTPDKISSLAATGVKNLMVYPLGFVADNSETIYEIGMLYNDLAKEKGITNYKRIDALNDEPLFIEALKQVIMDTANKKWPDETIRIESLTTGDSGD